MSDCQIMSNVARVADKWVATWLKMVLGGLVGSVLIRLRAIIHVKSKGSVAYAKLDPARWRPRVASTR